MAFVYILRCSDDSYYVGSTRTSLEARVAEHNAGKYRGHTWNRRPVKLVYHETFANITDAIAAERQLKGWSRAKKEALMNGDMPALQTEPRSARQGFPEHLSRRTLLRAPQDEVRRYFKNLILRRRRAPSRRMLGKSSPRTSRSSGPSEGRRRET